MSRGNAQACRDALIQLWREGRCNIDGVLREARRPSSPLHGEFEWNDRKAADSYRREQAGRLIRALVFEWDDAQAGETVVIPYFHRADLTEKTGNYSPAFWLKTDKALSMLVVKRALAEARQWQDRYQRFARYFRIVFKGIDAAERLIEKDAVRRKTTRKTK